MHQIRDFPMPELTVNISPSRYVTAELASAVTGYTPKAMDRKRQEGVWVEGREWVRAPDGRILYDLEGYERWGQRGCA